ncbi:hypothetical protein V8B97DRAFT_1558033 [Scleroderma yunnanense]
MDDSESSDNDLVSYIYILEANGFPTIHFAYPAQLFDNLHPSTLKVWFEVLQPKILARVFGYHRTSLTCCRKQIAESIRQNLVVLDSEVFGAFFLSNAQKSALGPLRRLHSRHGRS